MLARVVYIQAAAFVKPKLPAFAVFKKAPFSWPDFDEWATFLRDYTAQRLAERQPVDVGALQAQVAALLAENEALKAQLAVPGSPDSAMPTPVPMELLQVPVPATVQVPALSSGPTVQEAMADWEALQDLAHLKTRELDAILPGLGQRVSRTRKVVCLSVV